MKRNALNQLTLDLALPTVLAQPTVAFHLWPLSGTAPTKAAAKAANPKRRSRSPYKQAQPKGRGKSGSKGRKGKSRGPNVPSALINEAFNLPNGCKGCKAGESCAKGAHLRAEPGCFKAHSVQDHK